MPTTREKKQDAKNAIEKSRQNDFEALKIGIEKKKLCIEKWKLLVTLLVPIFGFAAIVYQLYGQRELKEKELEAQLFLKAIEAKDGDTLLRKLIYTGALDDSKKKYSFLALDTVWVHKPGRLDFEDTMKHYIEKDISCGWPNHNKLIGERIDATNFQAKIYNDGKTILSFDLGTNESIEDFEAILFLKDSSNRSIYKITFPSISIPPYGIINRKHIVYQAIDINVKNNFSKISCAGTDWKTERAGNWYK